MLSKPGDMIPLSRPEHEIKMDYPSIVSDFNLSLGVAAAVFVALVGFLGIAWNDPKLAPRTVSGIHMVAPFVAIPVILLIVRVVRRAARLIGHQRHRKMHQLLTVASLVILFYSVGVATSWFFWMMDDIETRYPSTPMPPDLM